MGFSFWDILIAFPRALQPFSRLNLCASRNTSATASFAVAFPRAILCFIDIFRFDIQMLEKFHASDYYRWFDFSHSRLHGHAFSWFSLSQYQSNVNFIWLSPLRKMARHREDRISWGLSISMFISKFLFSFPRLPIIRHIHSTIYRNERMRRSRDISTRVLLPIA